MRTFTRDGFPWPRDVPVYHATVALRKILRNGFKPRAAQKNGGAVLGGRHVYAVSFTLDPRVAESICLGINVLRAVATRELSAMDIFRGFGFMGDVAQQALAGIFINAPDVLTGIWMLDQGWEAEAFFGDKTPPPEAVAIKENAYWVPVGWDAVERSRGLSAEGRRLHGTPEKEYNARVLEMYGTLLNYCDSRHMCFNPLFVMTDVTALKTLDPRDIGVVEARLDVDRICVDYAGAVDLGYLPGGVWNPVLDDEFRSTYITCMNSLEANAASGRLGCVGSEKGYWFMRHSRYLLEESGYAVMFEGDCSPEDTVLYIKHLKEVQIFNPKAISIVDYGDLAAIEQTSAVSMRQVTYPYFKEQAPVLGEGM